MDKESENHCAQSPITDDADLSPDEDEILPPFRIGINIFKFRNIFLHQIDLENIINKSENSEKIVINENEYANIENINVDKENNHLETNIHDITSSNELNDLLHNEESKKIQNESLENHEITDLNIHTINPEKLTELVEISEEIKKTNTKLMEEEISVDEMKFPPCLESPIVETLNEYSEFLRKIAQSSSINRGFEIVFSANAYELINFLQKYPLHLNIDRYINKDIREFVGTCDIKLEDTFKFQLLKSTGANKNISTNTSSGYYPVKNRNKTEVGQIFVSFTLTILGKKAISEVLLTEKGLQEFIENCKTQSDRDSTNSKLKNVKIYNCSAEIQNKDYLNFFQHTT